MNRFACLLVVIVLGCSKGNQSMSADPLATKPTATASAPNLEEALAVMAKSGLSLTRRDEPARAPRWVPPSNVGFGAFTVKQFENTRGGAVAQVYVYAFADETGAAAQETPLRAMLLDGERSALIRRGRTLFWVTAPLSLPSGVVPPGNMVPFDTLVATLQAKP